MEVTRLQYLQHLLGCADYVSSGRKGMICEDRFLIAQYDPRYYDLLQTQLKNKSPRVRIETIMLLTALKERQAVDDISKMRVSDIESVSDACSSYLSAVEVEDRCIPELMDIIRHRHDESFFKAARKLSAVGRKEDIDDIRIVYGQTSGKMRDAIRETLENIVDRYPDLVPKKDLILSVPIYPDEEKLAAFLDKATVYMDIRYRENVMPRRTISSDVHNNVVRTMKKIQIRLYNERVNLRYYSDETKEAYDDAADLLAWMAADLRSKNISQSSAQDSRKCSRCGASMAHSNDVWICPECGNKSA